MNRLFHGWISLIMMGTIVSIGFFEIFSNSIVYSALYLGVVIIGLIIVLIAFCSKCKCKDSSCRHIIFGIITRYLSKRMPGKYSFFDIFLTVIGLLSIIIFPQYWLIKSPFLFGLFWTTCIILFMEITFFICKKCENDYCPVKILGKTKEINCG